MSSFKDAEYTVRKQNKATPKQVENSMAYSDILEKINEYKPSNIIQLTYLLVCKLYFQGTIVFRNDLSSIKLVSGSKKAKDLKPQFNYITLDKAGVPVAIIMKNYKSKETYGVQRFVISDEVKKCLMMYLKDTGKLAGEFLFTNSKGVELSKDHMRALIDKATEAVLGKSININLIRRIQITDFLQRGAHSIADSEADAHRYLHSVATHNEYLSIGLKSDDE